MFSHYWPFSHSLFSFSPQSLSTFFVWLVFFAFVHVLLVRSIAIFGDVEFGWDLRDLLCWYGAHKSVPQCNRQQLVEAFKSAFCLFSRCFSVFALLCASFCLCLPYNITVFSSLVYSCIHPHPLCSILPVIQLQSRSEKARIFMSTPFIPVTLKRIHFCS